MPHIFDWTKCATPAVEARTRRAAKRQRLEEQLSAERDEACYNVETEEVVPFGIEAIHPPPVDVPEHMSRDASSQCHVESPVFTAWKFRDAIHFYTGLETYAKFVKVLQSLGPDQHELAYFHCVRPSLAVEDQFFLTLVKLRQDKVNFELAIWFGISEKSVTNVFVTWVNFLAASWDDIDWWPSRELVNFYTPSDFKAKFPRTRVIVDGTECPIHKVQQPIIQQASFSTYKNRNTTKVLVGCSPGGLVSYVSDAYCGAASDRQIVERSSLLQACDSGDAIMADKGFNVQDLFIPFNVVINIPTFFKKKNRLTGEIVIKDRKIASKRVHVERIIGLAKTYKILQKPMTNTESDLATQIIKICFRLCNFRARIVSKDA